MSFRFAEARPRRRPSLTPMIDVVFLLLVFFMLAARFGQEGALDLRLAAAGPALAWQGPPRIVVVETAGLRVNGRAVPEDRLAEDLLGLMERDTDLVLLRPAEDVTLQRLLDVMALLEGGGVSAVALVQP